MKRGKGLARSRLKNKQPAGGFPEEVRVKARLRSQGVCEVGSSACTGSAAHFHHRKLRRFKDHSLVNCLHACSACHALIHDQPELSYMMGWMVRSWQEPVEHLPKKGERWNAFHRPQP
jgi:hypothetical protein